VLFGKAWLAVDVIMLGCVPLAGVTAYAAAGRVVRQPLLRVWAALTYAFLPVATGVIASGRLGDAVAFVLIPLLLVSCARLLHRDPGYDGWRHVGAAALLLTLATAFAPVLYLIALPALLVAIVVVRLAAPPSTEGSAIRRTLAVVLVAAAPLLLLWPWTGSVLSHPSLALTVPGPAVPGLTATLLDPAHLLAAAPGGPGTPPFWVTAPLVFAGLAGLTRLAKRTVARAAWAVAVLAFGVGIFIAHLRVTAPYAGSVHSIVGWAGVPTAVIGAALITAALVAADGARERLARTSFSWRQPIALLLVIAAAAVPLMAGAAWLMRGAGDPVHRSAAQVVPAFAAAEATSGTRPGILALRTRPGGSLSYDLLRGQPAQIGAGDVAPSAADLRRLSLAVEDLGSARGDAATAALSTYGIRYVLVPAPVDARLAALLDRTPGLARRTTGGSGAIWQLTARAGRLVILPATTAARAVAATEPPTDAAALQPPPTVLAAGPVGARGEIPVGEPGRLLVLAESADSGWRAEVDGQHLQPATAWGWAQAFRLPPGGGTLRLWHSPGHRTGQLILEAVLVGLVVLLALPTPGGQRRHDDMRVPS
jgi:hypothetical protein